MIIFFKRQIISRNHLKLQMSWFTLFMNGVEFDRWCLKHFNKKEAYANFFYLVVFQQYIFTVMLLYISDGLLNWP